jgi:hypothetical protein
MTFTVIKTTAVSAVSEVRLYEETIDHLVDGHPEVPFGLPSLIEAVGTAVADPAQVERGHAGSYVYVDFSSTNASGDPLRVPVKPVSGTSARVQTAYFATAERPDVIWRREE